jgi:hypothetical protein
MRTVVIALISSCLCSPAFADEKTASVSTAGTEGPLAFAAGEIESALKIAGFAIVRDGSPAFEITLVSPKGANKLNEKPESFRIDVAQDAGTTKVRIHGADVRGVMYGGLDTAERIRMNGLLSIKSKSETPFLGVRAMKFNPPLKGNVYMSEEDLTNSAWFYDLDYWDRFMRAMAYNRYNTLTLWSSHPFDQMVRLKKYPEATTLSQDKLDKNIAFFHKLFRMAKSYGLDTYIVTWNIHMSPGFRAAHGLKDGQDSPMIRDYQKECIRELLREYLELTGLGTCPGENMPMSAAANAEWIRDVYLDTLANTGRKPPFIYRYWGARPKETATMLANANYPGEILLDIKFNGEHMYSSTKPHPEEMRWLTQSQRPYKLLWHLRNDCIFQLRWGDPEFVAEMLRTCGGAESAGFVMGSEIEIPGADRYHTSRTAGHRDWNFEFEKNWMRFAVWGRMGYNPKLADDYWIDRFSERFGAAAGKDAFLALKKASKIVPTATSFHWNYMNGDWYPEGNIGGWNTSDGMKKMNFRESGIFHDIREWMFNNVIDDSMMNVPDYVASCIVNGEETQKGVLTPPRVAAMLDEFATSCEEHGQAASLRLTKGTKEWQCMQLDLDASVALGRYYADKIRAATEQMTYLATSDESRKAAAVKCLENARDQWKRLADITRSHYVTHEVWLVGQFDWAMYLPDVEKDIDTAREMKPWTKEEHTWILADGKKLTAPASWRAEGWPKGVEPWIKEFNSRIRGRATAIEVPADSWIKTILNAESAGSTVIRLSASGVEEIKTRFRSVSKSSEGKYILVAELQAGGNELAVRYEKKSHALPTLELETVPAAIFLEAEDGRLTPPMQTLARNDAAGAAAIVVPAGSGRGEINGQVLDAGHATYEINIPRDGNYRLLARVFWKNTSNNSLFCNWDGGKPQLLGNDEEFGEWHWIKTEPNPLKAGRHTLVIRNRDENSVLDCMEVILDRQVSRHAAPNAQH